MELFERAAYYGLNSVLAIYLTNSIAEGGLGFSEESVGFLQGLIYACTYVVPILGGALADRYGYRRMLLVAFSLLATGYFISEHLDVRHGVRIPAGHGHGGRTVQADHLRDNCAHDDRENLRVRVRHLLLDDQPGCFCCSAGRERREGVVVAVVFTLSSIYCALMLIPAVFLYRDPPRPENSRTLREVLAGAAMVLGDARFMLMIFLYSGFWILYFQNFGSVLWFLRDFIDPTPVNRAFASIGIPLQFDAEHVTVINAGTIILLQVLVSRIVRDRKPLPTMVTGMVIGMLGFICLSFATTVWIFILGIAVFSIGEMTAHPKYYSYVGLVAPADRKAVYMGYAFLYGVIGSLLGSNLGGVLYESMLKPVVGQGDVAGDIRGFWMLFAGINLVAVAGLLLYNRY